VTSNSSPRRSVVGSRVERPQANPQLERALSRAYPNA
jgi:hypothetical protein